MMRLSEPAPRCFGSPPAPSTLLPTYDKAVGRSREAQLFAQAVYDCCCMSAATVAHVRRIPSWEL